ncbi:MAG: hypothetical protein D3906_05805, partial [Candidatus Electrothrix sp. AUS1_2]|nr:hypothetical protein [Candidatus Electrothrix sp. AUS1_2]
MEKNYNMFVGIDEIKGQPVKIKNSEFKVFSLDEQCSSNKTLRKKINEIKQFKQVGIFSSGLLVNQKCAKSSFTDRHGKTHEGYWTGVWFPCSGYEHYIKTTAKGCGVPISKIISQKESFDRIELISGICLYGGKKFQLKTCSGNLISLTELNFQLDEPVDDIFVDASYSVYEAEAITGLSAFINSLVQCNTNIETVHLEVPRGQYYLFLAEAYEKGYLSPDLFQSCIHEIDKRHEKI